MEPRFVSMYGYNITISKANAILATSYYRVQVILFFKAEPCPSAIGLNNRFRGQLGRNIRRNPAYARTIALSMFASLKGPKFPGIIGIPVININKVVNVSLFEMTYVGSLSKTRSNQL